MNTIDLFSGCGGMTLGFKWAGFNTILANDIDENCKKTFSRNFPNIPFINEDITKINKNTFDNIILEKEIDVVLGGPPCQGFSLANKKRNSIVEDPRNKLFYEFIKIINWYNPKSFVMENVKGLLSMESGKIIKQIILEFQNSGKFGYEVQMKLLKASDFGVPQTRERVIIIGIRKDLSLIPEFPNKLNNKEITLDDAISDLPIINAGEGFEKVEYNSKPKNEFQLFMRKKSKFLHNHVAMKHTQRLINRFKAIKQGENLLDVWNEHGAVQRGNPNLKSKIKFSQNNLRLFPNKPAPTIAASFQSNFIHPYLNRNFTAREGARLQSFPDDFIFEGMRTKMSWEKGLSQYQQIGNAVPPLMAFEIAKTHKNVLEKIKRREREDNFKVVEFEEEYVY